ncbi:MAG: hypothetical protein KGH79_04250 [Patescibacteria group bacterium]|nr:hypothetical protein [Patescibacteria group bacterium]
MAKTAAQSSAKWASNSQNGANNYGAGVQNTAKDQSALAIAAIPAMQAGLTAAFAANRQQKGLQRSGKAGWQAGALEKGVPNYQTGVAAPASKTKYEQNSGAYDSARSAAASVARGAKGSQGNLARVTAVVNAERAVKMGK